RGGRWRTDRDCCERNLDHGRPERRPATVVVNPQIVVRTADCRSGGWPHCLGRRLDRRTTTSCDRSEIMTDEISIKQFLDDWLAAWTGNRPDALIGFYAPDVYYQD